MADEESPDESDDTPSPEEQSSDAEEESDQTLDEELDEIIEEEMGDSSTDDPDQESEGPGASQEDAAEDDDISEERSDEEQGPDVSDSESAADDVTEASSQEEPDEERPDESAPPPDDADDSADEPSPEDLMEQTVGEQSESDPEEPSDDDVDDSPDQSDESTPDQKDTAEPDEDTDEERSDEERETEGDTESESDDTSEDTSEKKEDEIEEGTETVGEDAEVSEPSDQDEDTTTESEPDPSDEPAEEGEDLEEDTGDEPTEAETEPSPEQEKDVSDEELGDESSGEVSEPQEEDVEADDDTESDELEEAEEGDQEEDEPEPGEIDEEEATEPSPEEQVSPEEDAAGEPDESEAEPEPEEDVDEEKEEEELEDEQTEAPPDKEMGEETSEEKSEEAADQEGEEEGEASPEEQPTPEEEEAEASDESEEVEADVSDEESEEEDVEPESESEEMGSEPAADEEDDEEIEEEEPPEADVEADESEEELADEEAEEPEESEEEESSIKDMLEEESERAKEEDEAEEEEEEEEDLPEGYVTVEQLPEEEEFEVPKWARVSAYTVLGLLFFYFCWSYLFLPLWENYHVMQIEESIANERYERAEQYLDRGLALNGFLIHYPDRFVADFLKQVLDRHRFDQFQDVHGQFEGGYADGPRTKQVYAQFLLNRGRWEKALSVAEQLQLDPETRGIGYLFHGKANLKLGRISRARSDLNRAYNWMSDNPALKRLDRDIFIAEGNYEQAQRVANQLRSQVAESDEHSLVVRDYIQLARINAHLNRHRVTEDMLSQALEVDPRNRTALKELSFRYLIQERWELADPYVNGRRTQPAYRALYPMESFGWWGAAELMMAQGDVAQSIPMLERAKSLEPRNPEVHRVFGELHLEYLDDPNEASKNFERAREHGLQRLQFIETQAQAYYKSGQYQKTVEQYQILREQLDLDETKLKYNLGSAHLGAGNFDRARELLEDAFDSGYVNEAMYNQRGLLRELQGNPVDAQAMYFQGKEWATRNQVQVKLLQSNLDRSLAEQPPEPLSDWMAPLDRSIEIAYWRQLEPDKALGNL